MLSSWTRIVPHAAAGVHPALTAVARRPEIC
jgi:hypothetical protein